MTNKIELGYYIDDLSIEVYRVKRYGNTSYYYMYNIVYIFRWKNIVFVIGLQRKKCVFGM